MKFLLATLLTLTNLNSDKYSKDIFSQHGNYYLVIVDSSTHYNKLYQKMWDVHKLYAIQIDTLGRYYDKTIDEIILPHDDADEIYRGTYFPRRYSSESLSIEYDDYYSTQDKKENITNPANMILVAGMYENLSKADSLKEKLSTNFPNTYVQKSKLFIGCMH